MCIPSDPTKMFTRVCLQYRKIGNDHLNMCKGKTSQVKYNIHRIILQPRKPVRAGKEGRLHTPGGMTSVI